MHDELKKKFWSLTNKYELLISKKISLKNTINIKEKLKELSEVVTQLEQIATTGCFDETGYFWR